MRALLLLSVSALMLAGCGAPDRLRNVGQAPALSPIENPTTQAGYRPVSMPMPDVTGSIQNPNSLFRPTRNFFQDQRANKVGDILTVMVRITDQAKFDNTSQRSRAEGDKMGMPSFFGLEKGARASGMDPSNLVGLNSTMNNQGKGSVNRSESLVTNVSVVVTQVLPNGHLVIEGKQEVRVNYELREMVIAGVVRPEDIQGDNTVDSMKIAQARIGYGGRGQITDVQQPRYGQQVWDIIAPW